MRNPLRVDQITSIRTPHPHQRIQKPKIRKRSSHLNRPPHAFYCLDSILHPPTGLHVPPRPRHPLAHGLPPFQHRLALFVYGNVVGKVAVHLCGGGEGGWWVGRDAEGVQGDVLAQRGLEACEGCDVGLEEGGGVVCRGGCLCNVICKRTCASVRM